MGPSFMFHPWDQGLCLSGHQESPAPHLSWGLRCTGFKSLFLQAELSLHRFDTECFVPMLAVWEPETFKPLPSPMVWITHSSGSQAHLCPDWGNRWQFAPDNTDGCVCACMMSGFTHMTPCECSLGFSVHGFLQARILERVIMPASRGSSWPRGWTHASKSPALTGGFFNH